MPAFTKGKWTIKKLLAGWGVFAVNEGSREPVADCLDNEANARLIAAAPELYEAVCDLLDYAYEALHLAGGKNEIRGEAPRILRDIQEYQELLARIAGKDTDDTDA